MCAPQIDSGLLAPRLAGPAQTRARLSPRSLRQPPHAITITTTTTTHFQPAAATCATATLLRTTDITPMVPASASLLALGAFTASAAGVGAAFAPHNTWGGRGLTPTANATAANPPGLPLTDELLQTANLAARFWRFAANRSPSAGHPQYTFGGYGNTPSSPVADVGTYTVFDPTQWTSGFFSAGMWGIYERMTQCAAAGNVSGAPSSADWAAQASNWTDTLGVNSATNTHDLGFMAYPFQAQDRLTNSQRWNETISNMSATLGNRFVPAAGVVRTWDNQGSHPDSVLVIIDSVMNMPLLLESASNYTHNQTLGTIAHAHASKLIDHHVRPDGSTFHLCDYSGTTGHLYRCGTAQGYADNSTWSRGQAWALHGFTQLYSLTGNQTYLTTAQRVADYWIGHLPSDGLPYWDFNAPQNAKTPRDVSAAMAAASGLATLGSIGNASNYTTAAVLLLNATYNMALASPIDFSQASTKASGANLTITSSSNATGSAGFEATLMHSTVNNRGQNADTGLIYADTFFIEAGNTLLQQGVWPCSSALVAQGASASSTPAAGSGKGPKSAALWLAPASRLAFVAMILAGIAVL